MPELRIYGDIGALGISAESVTHALDELRSGRVDIRINSHGGKVYEAIAIHNAIARHPARITAHIDGIAASSASFIAQAADEILINEHARMMIHDPWKMTLGNALELGVEVANLNALGDIIASIYADRAGGTSAEWRDRMRAAPDGIWFNADEAVSAGLADRVIRTRESSPAPGAPAGRSSDLQRVVTVAAARRQRTKALAQKG